MKLNIGTAGIFISIPKPALAKQRIGRRARFCKKIAQPCNGCPKRPAIFVIGVIARAFADDKQVNMVLQISPNPGKIMPHLDAKRSKMVCRADARLHE